MEIGIWIGFVCMILGFLALDLGVFNKRDHVIGFRESLTWTAVWILVSIGFSGAVYVIYDQHVAGFGSSGALKSSGSEALLSYVSGYIVEYSLSVDNIFVIALIVSAFRIPRRLQHRVLFWGIIGALLLRGMMIGLGAALLHEFSWMMYVFGGILLFTAGKMALSHADEHPDFAKSLTVRIARRFFPVSPELHGNHFVTRLPDGRKALTPLMIVLLLVETTDVLFAVDSIPAVFAVTRDPFLVFTSNVFAILGLRSLYFAVAGLLGLFRYLKASLVVLMAFIGLKMLASDYVHLGAGVSLAIIGAILLAGVLASLVEQKRHPVVDSRLPPQVD